MIGIINYGSGNLGAIANIYKQLKIPHIVSGDLDELASASSYILPGVGAFDATMRHLNESGMVDMLKQQVLCNKKKVLGICVGMQILSDSSEEGVLNGLGWIPGQVRMLDASKLSHKPKLPHMGWNSVNPCANTSLFDDVDVNIGFYFLHSYYFDASDSQDITATVEYGEEITCGVARDNIFGVQFHPEKSHTNGMTVFRNFARL